MAMLRKHVVLSGILVWISFSLLPLSPALTSSRAATPEELFQKAAALDRDGFLNESAVAWEQCLQSNLEGRLRSVAALKLSSTYFKLGRFGKAIENAQKLTALEPKNYHAYFHLGNALSGIKRFDEAVQAYKQVVQLRAEEGLGHVALALSHFGNSQPDEAVRLLKEAKAIFKRQKNIVWHQNTRIMIKQIRNFAKYPPSFADLWLGNNLKMVRETYEKTVFSPPELKL